jgi:hypothetical protein
MALRSFNSVSGFSTGQDPQLAIISDIGNVTPVNLTVSELTNLGPIGNITITGGSNGQIITTDGSGVLSFADTSADNSAAPMPYIIVSGDTFIVPENFQGLYSQAIDIEGTLEVDGILIEVGVSQNAFPYEVYYDNGGLLTGNAGFTFQPTTGDLAIPGNFTATGNLMPGANVTYDIGSSASRWKDLYLSGTSIFLGTSSITEDASGDIVLTNGDGGTWTFGGAQNLDQSIIANGTSNVRVLLNGNIAIGAAGNANIVNINGAGVITSSGNVVPLGIKTDNYYYANGVAIDFAHTSAAGANTQIQYNNNGDFGAEAAFTYDQATNTLSADNIAGTLTTVSQPNITSVGTLTALTVTGNATAGNIIAASGTVQYGTNPGAGTITVSNASTTAGIFASGITDINLGLAANITMGATGKTVTARGNVTADNLQATTLSVGDFYSSRTAVAVGTANTVIDTFAASSYRSAKYTLKVSDSTGYQAVEALLVHDDINSIITVYGSISTTGTELVSLSTVKNGSNIELRASPTNSGTSVNLMGTYVPD